LQEVFEETGIHYEIERLAVIHENFFNNNSGSLTPFVSATKRRAVWLSKICNRLKFGTNSLAFFLLSALLKIN